MAKARIQFITKNSVLIGDPIFYDTNYIPRVGEIIDAKDFLNLPENNHFLVISVIYKMTEKGFVPCIAAKEWFKGLRYEELESYGWLTPVSMEPPNHSYDEDLYSD